MRSECLDGCSLVDLCVCVFVPFVSFNLEILKTLCILYREPDDFSKLKEITIMEDKNKHVHYLAFSKTVYMIPNIASIILI